MRRITDIFDFAGAGDRDFESIAHRYPRVARYTFLPRRGYVERRQPALQRDAEHDVASLAHEARQPPSLGSEHHDALHREVRAVAEEIAADPKYADDEPLGPDEHARDRFRDFARKQLAGD